MVLYTGSNNWLREQPTFSATTFLSVFVRKNTYAFGENFSDEIEHSINNI